MFINGHFFPGRPRVRVQESNQGNVGPDPLAGTCRIGLVNSSSISLHSPFFPRARGLFTALSSSITTSPTIASYWSWYILFRGTYLCAFRALSAS